MFEFGEEKDYFASFRMICDCMITILSEEDIRTVEALNRVESDEIVRNVGIPRFLEDSNRDVGPSGICHRDHRRFHPRYAGDGLKVTDNGEFDVCN
jgi:hypothetical protein